MDGGQSLNIETFLYACLIEWEGGGGGKFGKILVEKMKNRICERRENIYL